MKILIINTLYYPYKVGGAEISVQILAEELVCQGHEVFVISLQKEKGQKKDVINGVNVIYIHLSNFYWPFDHRKHSKLAKIFWHLADIYNPVMGRKVSRIINELCPDVVHTNNLAGFSVSIWNVISRKKIKLIHTARDYYLFHPNNTLFKKDDNISPSSSFVKLYSWFFKKISHKVDIFIGISHYIKDLHVDNGFFCLSKSFTIYNPIDVCEKYKRNPVKKINSVGFIGRHSRDKGYLDFLKIASNFEQFEFSSIGSFRSKDEKEQFFSSHVVPNNYRYLGFMDVNDYLCLVDCIIVPSKWEEPFGRVVVEAALAKKYVFVNSVGGMKELIDVFDNVYEVSNFPQVKYNVKIKSNVFYFKREEVCRQYLNTYLK